MEVTLQLNSALQCVIPLGDLCNTDCHPYIRKWVDAQEIRVKLCNLVLNEQNKQCIVTLIIIGDLPSTIATGDLPSTIATIVKGHLPFTLQKEFEWKYDLKKFHQICIGDILIEVCKRYWELIIDSEWRKYVAEHYMVTGIAWQENTRTIMVEFSDK